MFCKLILVFVLLCTRFWCYEKTISKFLRAIGLIKPKFTKLGIPLYLNALNSYCKYCCVPCVIKNYIINKKWEGGYVSVLRDNYVNKWFVELLMYFFFVNFENIEMPHCTPLSKNLPASEDSQKTSHNNHFALLSHKI